MKKILVIALTVALFFVGSVVITQDAQAVPAFARQTGHACTTCHFQTYPSLNSFGRAFKAGGFTQIGDQGKIEDEGLSIPNVLNASLVTKFRYQQAGGKGTVGGVDYSKYGKGKGELQIPDEAALLIGGRAAENVGFLLEADAGEGLLTSFKMPIGLYHGGDTNLELVLFTTDALGASYGYELLNTGSLRSQRPWEARTAMSAQQYIGTATAAEGFALGVASDMFFVNLSLWGPAHGTVDTGFNLSQYARVAITPNVGGWDLGVGLQYWGGETTVGDKDAMLSSTASGEFELDPATGTISTTKNTAGSAGVYETKATAFDIQAQGEVGGMPLGVYISYATAPKKDTGSTKTNLFNDTTANDMTATAIAAEIGVVPNKVTLGAGYRMGQRASTSDRDDNAIMIGGKYMLAQNVQVQLNYEMYSGSYYTANSDAVGKKNGTSLLTLMLFSAF